MDLKIKKLEKDCLLLLDNNHLPELNRINVTVSALGSSGKALLRWPSKKVLLLRKNDLACYDLIKDSCDWKVFLPDDNFDSDAFNNSIK